MNKLATTAAVYFLIITLAGTFSSAGTYSGGSGRADDPYKISKLDDILELGRSQGDWGSSFVVVNDIDMARIDFTPIAGSLHNAFNGSIEGRGFTISNLMIKGEKGQYAGMFGVIGAAGKIHNLKLHNIDIDVFVADNVVKDNFIYVGGFAGNSNGEFRNCSVSGKIKARAKDLAAVGGICGRIYNSVINRCQSSVTVSISSTGRTFAGGLVGYCYATTMLNNISISDVYAAGNKQTYAGGITGYALHTKFSSCSSDAGTILTDSGGYAGGITGYNYNGHITNCYAVNNVFSFSNGFAGGIAGGNYNSIIRNCYFSGALSQKRMKSKHGAIAGMNKASQILNCYWNYDTSLATAPIADGKFIGTVTMLTQQQINAGGIFSDPKWNADSPASGALLWEIHSNKLPTLNRNGEENEP